MSFVSLWLFGSCESEKGPVGELTQKAALRDYEEISI